MRTVSEWVFTGSPTQSVADKCARVHVAHAVSAQVYLPPRATVNAQRAHSLSLMSALLSGIWHTATVTHVHMRVTIMTMPGRALFEVHRTTCATG